MSDNEYGIEDLFDEPYARRQFVQFMDIDDVASVRNLDNIPVWKAFYREWSEEADEENIWWRHSISAEVYYAFKAFGKVTAKKIQQARSKGVGILPIPLSKADYFNLAPGHPQKKVLYAAHPSDRLTYLPTAEFHRLAFEHKFAEAIRLLMHLGASTINVEHERGWDQEFAAKLSAGIPEANANASVEASGGAHTRDRLLYEADLEGHSDPHIPDDLVWYPHEPTWQSAAEGRIDFGMEKFNLKLQYTEDYGVNADLAIDLQNIGIGLGGSFEKHQNTIWSLDGVFGG